MIFLMDDCHCAVCCDNTMLVLLLGLAVCGGRYDAQVTERRSPCQSYRSEEAPQQEGEVGPGMARTGGSIHV